MKKIVADSKDCTRWADGRITLGFAFDTFQYLPKEYLDPLIAKLREHKIDVITFHYLYGAIMGNVDVSAKLHDSGILDERFLVAHSSNLTQEDADLYKRLGVHVSSTPRSVQPFHFQEPATHIDDGSPQIAQNYR